MAVPDPNWFGGEIEIGDRQPRTGGRCPPSTPTPTAIYRIIGVADMAHAIRENRPHRASGELAFHVLEVMEAFQRSSDTGTHVAIASAAGAAGDAAGQPRRRRARLSVDR